MAKLFIGIFVTMIPALILLKATVLNWACPIRADVLGHRRPVVLPGQHADVPGLPPDSRCLGATQGITTSVGTVSQIMLEAISAGAVFMGANTYIGNAPNFMVKSIAEENKIKNAELLRVTWAGP